MLAQFFNYISSVCINSQYTSMFDSELDRLEWLELSEHEIRNVTQKAFASKESCDKDFMDNSNPRGYRSLCPWEYVRDFDEGRFPPVLYVAKCTCRSCLQYSNYQCKPVLYSIPVLKKQCRNGIVEWMRKTHLISVACTCVRPELRIIRKRLSRILNIDYFDIY